VITGRVLPERQATNAGVVPSTKIDPEPRRYAGRIWDDVLYPMNMAMARATARRIGGFDERLGSGTSFPAEDNDYGYRALEIGCTIAYVPEAVVWHRAWRTDLLRLRWQYGRGQGAFFAKHLSWHDRYIAQRIFAEWRRYVGLSAHYAIRLDRRAMRYAPQRSA
jgi:GT2 family glycosyltransferase